MTPETLLAAVLDALRASALEGVSIIHSEPRFAEAGQEGSPFAAPSLIAITSENSPAALFRSEAFINSLHAAIAEGSE